jgi:hypothetical protein
MTRVVVNATIRAQLHNLDAALEVCDESGQTLGYFHPIVEAGVSGKITSPYTDEEIEELRKQRTGRPLAEILKGLDAS